MTSGPLEPQPGNPGFPAAPGDPAYQGAPGTPAYQTAPGYQGGSLQPQPQYPVTQVVAPKNGAIGLLLSFFIPGLGSIVNGNVNIGVIILVTAVVGWILSFFLIGIPIALGAWIWGMIDGYQSAGKWNQAHGIIGA